MYGNSVVEEKKSSQSLRGTAGEDILRLAEELHKRACHLNDLMADKLAPVTMATEPCPTSGGAINERPYPPMFERLRQSIRLVDLYLDGIADTLNRVDL